MTTTDELLDALRESDARICAWEIDAGVPDGDDPQSNTRWHTVALEGEWKGHWQGAFRVNREHLEQIAANFAAVHVDTVVDYEHATEMGAFAGGAPAAGWIDQLQIRDGDVGAPATLSARINWTDKAAAHIRAREYRYLSPVIAFRTRDRASGQDLGASIPSVALTNTPFLDELPEVRLNSSPLLRRMRLGASAPQERLMNEQLKALALSLALPEGATIEQIHTAVQAAQADALALTQVARALGTDEGAEPAAIAARAAEVAAQAKAVQGVDLVQLQKDAAAARRLRADQLFEAASNAGKIVASNRQWARELVDRDPRAFEAWSAAAPQVVPVSVVRPPARAERSLSTPGTEPTDEDIRRLSAMPDIINEAKGACIGVEAYVRANYADLAEQYA